MAAKVLALRSDPEVDAAMAELGEQFGNTTDTLRTAVLELARSARSRRIRAEAEQAAADPQDRAEMAAVLAEMEALGEG